jgi:hypothetical protein
MLKLQKSAQVIILCISLLISDAFAPTAARESDVDRNLMLIDSPSLTVELGPNCGITEDDARNMLFLHLARNHFNVTNHSESTYLYLGIECFESTPGAIFFAVELSLSVEAITVFDLEVQANSKDKQSGPSLSVATIWLKTQHGTASLAMRRPQLENAIKALADSFVVRRLQAAMRLHSNNKH